MADKRAELDPRGLLIPNIVDRLAEASPNAVFAEYPKAVLTYDDGYRSVTYQQLANAINGVAKWIVDSIGYGDGYEKLAYFGPNDMRYPVLHCGAIKAGYCMYFPSPRNSIPAHRSLLETLNCTKLISPTPRPPPVDAILADRELQVLNVASVDELLENKYPPFPYTKTLSEAASLPHLTVHTSGSTGFPKPIATSHGHVSKNITMLTSDPPAGHKSQDQSVKGKRIFLPFPSFHAGGIGSQLLWGIVMGAIMVLPTSGSIPSAAGMVEALKKTKVDIAFIPPSIIAELGQSPELLDFCADRLQSIMYVGGDLPKELGDRVASRIPIFNQYGATELGMVPLLQADDRDPLDWKYVQFHPGIGPEFRPYRDEEHQLFLVRTEATEPNIPVFSLFPDLTEYSTRDLFVRHPQKKDLWRWSGRADDIIVFLNGEKTNPISMEQHIVSRNADVTAAIVAGNQRFQASLIIEIPSKDGKAPSPVERAALIEKIWPSIEEANQECPAHARIAKSHILFTTPDKPVIRTGKGTIQRAGTLALYKDELDALYRDADRVTAQTEDAVAGSGPVDDVKLISEFITKSVLAITKWPALDRTDNFFLKGIDSLQAITLVRWLRQGLQNPKVSVPLVYSNPSVEGLSRAIVQLLHNERELEEAQKEAARKEARSILSEYQALIDGPSQQQTVILTGSTGIIGSYILDELVANQSIKRVWCLDRREKEDSIKRHKELRQSRGLSPFDFKDSKITFLKVDLTDKSFALTEEVYKQLRESVTLVIHNAWPVNFNLSLSSFRPQLTGVVNLIDFCSSSALSPGLFFVSSFSSMASFQSESGAIPEEVISNHEPSINGYVGSKYIAERLLEYAAKKRPGFHASVARVGQVAGAVRNRDMWNKTEWFPSLVISSLRIGALPESLGPELDNIDWVPADLLAEVLVELALAGGNNSSVQVFHPLNLHPTSWSAIKPTVSDELFKLSGKKVETVFLSEWVNRVRQHMEQIAGSHQALAEGEMESLVEDIPAVKLLDFYQTILDNTLGSNATSRNVFSTAKTAGASQKLQAVDGVKEEWVRKWIREWFSTTKS